MGKYFAQRPHVQIKSQMFSSPSHPNSINKHFYHMTTLVLKILCKNHMISTVS